MGPLDSNDPLAAFAQAQQVTEQDRQRAQAALLAQLGAGLLGNRHWQQGLAQGLSNGSQAYQDTLAAGPRSRAAAWMDQGKAIDVASKMQGYQDDRAARDALQSFQPQTPWARAASSVPSMAPTPGNTDAFAGALDSQPKNRNYDLLIQQAEALESKGLWQQGAKYREQAEKYRPKVDTTPRYGTDEQGRRIAYVLDDQGNYNRLPVGPDVEKAHFVDDGQRTGLALDPFTGAARNQGYQRYQTPDSQASNAVAWANQRTSAGRLQLDQDKFNAERQQAGANAPKLDPSSQKHLEAAREQADRANALGDLASQFGDINTRTSTGNYLDKMPWTPTFSQSKQSLEALTANMIPLNRQAGSGSTSDKDAATFERAMPSIAKAGTVNAGIVQGLQVRQQIANDRVAFLEAWASAKGSTLGADQAWRAYLNANPIFDHSQGSSQLAPRLNQGRMSWQQYFGGAQRGAPPAAQQPRPQPQRAPGIGDIEAEMKRRGIAP